jgi:hypothetical protein
MNRTNIDWRTFVIVLLVIVFLVGPLFGLIGGFVRIPAVSIAVAAFGAGWLISAGLGALRGGGGRRRGSVLGSSKVTYWRGQRIETRQSARARVQANLSTVPLLVSAWYIAMGLGCAYTAVILLGQLSGLL